MTKDDYLETLQYLDAELMRLPERVKEIELKDAIEVWKLKAFVLREAYLLEIGYYERSCTDDLQRSP